MEILRQYGVSTWIQFPLVGRGSQDYCGSAIHASGDIRLVCDGSGKPPISSGYGSGFWHIEGGEFIYYLADSDLQYRSIAVKIDDLTSPKIYEPQTILIATYGSVSAMYQFNLNAPTVAITSGALAISGAVVVVSGGALNADISTLYGNISGLAKVANISTLYMGLSGFTRKEDVSGLPGIYSALSGLCHWSDVSGVALKTDVSAVNGILTAASGPHALIAAYDPAKTCQQSGYESMSGVTVIAGKVNDKSGYVLSGFAMATDTAGYPAGSVGAKLASVGTGGTTTNQILVNHATVTKKT